MGVGPSCPASGGGAASYRGLHSETSHNFIFAKVRENRVLIQGWITGHEVIAYDQPIHGDCWTIKDYRLYPITDLPEFPQLLPDGIMMFTPPVKKLGTIT